MTDTDDISHAVAKILDWIDFRSRDGGTEYTVAVPASIKPAVAEELRKRRYRVQTLQRGLCINWS